MIMLLFSLNMCRERHSWEKYDDDDQDDQDYLHDNDHEGVDSLLDHAPVQPEHVQKASILGKV